MSTLTVVAAVIVREAAAALGVSTATIHRGRRAVTKSVVHWPGPQGLDVIPVSSAGRSGLDVLAEIRRRPSGSEIPILMLTGYGLNPEVLTRIDRHGAPLLHKSVSLTTIVQ